MWKSKKIPGQPTKYLPWTMVKTESKYYMIMEKSKLEFISVRAFHSWGRPAILSSEEALSKYPTWRKLGFALGSLVQTVDRNIYVICGSNLLEPEYKRIATPDVFDIGYKINDFIQISDAELKFHKKGEEISGIWF